jgi:hypothetical protein
LSSNYLRKNKLKSVKIFLSRLIFFVFFEWSKFFFLLKVKFLRFFWGISRWKKRLKFGFFKSKNLNFDLSSIKDDWNLKT